MVGVEARGLTPEELRGGGGVGLQYLWHLRQEGWRAQPFGATQLFTDGYTETQKGLAALLRSTAPDSSNSRGLQWPAKGLDLIRCCQEVVGGFEWQSVAERQ